MNAVIKSPLSNTDTMVEQSHERLDIMVRQEQNSYHIDHSVATATSCLNDRRTTDSYPTSSTIPGASTEQQPLPCQIDVVECRRKMAAWAYDLVQFCQMNFETAELTMSCLDRFMFTSANHKRIGSHVVCQQAKQAAWTNKKVYQLTAMTCMYMAVKIQEPAALSPNMVADKLSRNVYQAVQIENMEAVILESLQWMINPPTISSFVHELVITISPLLLSCDADESAKSILLDPYVNDTFYDLIREQIKLSVTDYDFVFVKASIKAYCFILNALEFLNVHDKTLHAIERVMIQSLGINNDDIDAVEGTRYKIHSIMMHVDHEPSVPHDHFYIKSKNKSPMLIPSSPANTPTSTAVDLTTDVDVVMNEQKQPRVDPTTSTAIILHTPPEKIHKTANNHNSKGPALISPGPSMMSVSQ